MTKDNLDADHYQCLFITLNNSIHAVLNRAIITQAAKNGKGNVESLKRSLMNGINNNDKINRKVIPVINGIRAFLYCNVLNTD
jgi:hypothetical protein